jgi:multiple sugar transport system permease protein
MNTYQKFIINIIVGSFWGLVSNIVIGIFLILTLGKIINFNYFEYMLVSSVICISYNYFNLKNISIKISLFLLTFFLLLILTGFNPYGFNLSTNITIQFIFLLFQTLIIFIGTSICLKDFNKMSFNRIFLEIIFIKVFKGLGFTFFLTIVIFPFYVMLLMSFKIQSLLILNPLDLSVDFSRGLSLFRSYIELFSEWGFGKFLFNSLIVSLSSIFIALIFSIPGAYAVARFNFPGKFIMINSILLIYLIPMITLLIPLYSFFTFLNLRDSLFGLIIVYPAVTIPVAIYMLQGYFKTIPQELEEAGLIDGLSRTGVILKITLPLSLPAIASVSLFIFMVAWNEYLFAYMFLDTPDIFTLPRGLEQLDGEEVPRQHLMAGSVIATVPVIVVFLFAEKYLQGGLTAGGIKG